MDRVGKDEILASLWKFIFLHNLSVIGSFDLSMKTNLYVSYKRTLTFVKALELLTIKITKAIRRKSPPNKRIHETKG